VPVNEVVGVTVAGLRRSRAKTVASVVVDPASDPEAKPSVAPRRGGRTKRDEEMWIRAVETELPTPTWRPVKPARGGEVLEPEGAGAETSDEHEEEVDLAPRRSRRRRRRGRRDDEPVTTHAWTDDVPTVDFADPEPTVSFRSRNGKSEVTPKPEPPARAARASRPAPASRELVAIPEDAPQVVITDGIPTLVRDKRVLPPLFFFGNSTFGPTQAETVLEQVRLAGANGVKCFAHLIDLEVAPGAVDDSVRFAAYLLKKTIEIVPDAQVLFRVVFVAPEAWEKLYPKAKYIAESGGIAEPSVCDDEFWEVAERCLVDFVRLMRKLPLAKQILGVHLDRGEWFFAEGWGYDTSIAAHEKFREWVRTRYRDDLVALRSAWFDGQAQFQTIGIPEFGQQVRAGERFVRTGRKARRWVDYHLFLSDTMVERIGKLALATKKASEGMFLVGVSYGYTFEWAHPASGHLSLGKLLRTPEIDFIAGPPSYKNREPGGAAAFPSPIDSFALNGKLYVSEEDFKTPISGKQEPDEFNPVMRTPQALESVHWRGAGAALAHGAGVAWMDLWGNGWLNTNAIWQRARSTINELVRRRGVPLGEPEAAVFIDERSLAYLVDERAFGLLVQNVREAIMRSGLSVGFYLLSDLAHRENFPESKLYVFLNAWDVRPEVRSAIKSRLQRGGKVLLWLYSAGLFDGGRESLERVREITGIALKPQPFNSRSGSTMLNRRHPLCEALPERLLSGGGQLEPSYFAIPEDGVVLGEYSQTGLPSFVLREFGLESGQSWVSVFLGEPVVTPALFRALGQMAGAHVWNYQEDVVHVRPPFLSLHSSGAGVRTITLPDKWSAYNVFAEDWAAIDSTHLRFTVTDGSTHQFLVGPRGELETLLARDPAELLTVEHIPPRLENTIRLDAVNFDVTVMKLDEWIEEGASDDAVDDLLLRPPAVDLDALEEKVTEEVERTSGGSRSRRRRKRGARGGGSEESATARKEGADAATEDVTVNVVFRKRT
jgi:hypothetical protein